MVASLEEAEARAAERTLARIGLPLDAVLGALVLVPRRKGLLGARRLLRGRTPARDSRFGERTLVLAANQPLGEDDREGGMGRGKGPRQLSLQLLQFAVEHPLGDGATTASTAFVAAFVAALFAAFSGGVRAAANAESPASAAPA